MPCLQVSKIPPTPPLPPLFHVQFVLKRSPFSIFRRDPVNHKRFVNPDPHLPNSMPPHTPKTLSVRFYLRQRCTKTLPCSATSNEEGSLTFMWAPRRMDGKVPTDDTDEPELISFALQHHLKGLAETAPSSSLTGVWTPTLHGQVTAVQTVSYA